MRQIEPSKQLQYASDRATARCGACGCNWEYERHEALRCPFCNAEFIALYMSHDGSYLDFEGRRP
jgi:uncharacterized CHY-type Zn-finger protein